MNPRQRQMIKEAYQAGYQEALDEGLGSILAKAGKFLKNLFKRADDVVDDVTPTATPEPPLMDVDPRIKTQQELDDILKRAKKRGIDDLFRTKETGLRGIDDAIDDIGIDPDIDMPLDPDFDPDDINP